MGLDMYLTREVYVGANYPHNMITGTVELFRGEEKKPIKVDINRISSITEHVGYWRKANAIHKWFVDNVQDGVDECQRSWIAQEKLSELLEVCKQILANKELAPKLLPTQSGFFFGPTEYNEWYFEDIQSTVSILQPIVDGFETDSNEYYYRSSW